MEAIHKAVSSKKIKTDMLNIFWKRAYYKPAEQTVTQMCRGSGFRRESALNRSSTASCSNRQDRSILVIILPLASTDQPRL